MFINLKKYPLSRLKLINYIHISSNKLENREIWAVKADKIIVLDKQRRMKALDVVKYDKFNIFDILKLLKLSIFHLLAL